MSVETDDTRHERAHNYWLSLLDGRAMPTIADLTAERLGEFKDYSFLIAIAAQDKSPVVSFAGKEIFAGTDAPALKAGVSLDTVAEDSFLSALGDEFSKIKDSCEPLQFNTSANDSNSDQASMVTLVPFGAVGAVQFIWGVLSDPQNQTQTSEVSKAPEVSMTPEVGVSFDEPADDGISFEGGSDGQSDFDSVQAEDNVFESEEAFEQESFVERERLSGFDVYEDTYADEAFDIAEIATEERSDLGTGDVPSDVYLGFDDRADSFEGEAYEMAEVVTDEGAIVFYDEDTGFDADIEPDAGDGFAGSIAEVGEENEFDGFVEIDTSPTEATAPASQEPESKPEPESDIEEGDGEEAEEDSEENEVPFFNILADGRTAADGVVHVDQRSRLSLYDVLAKAFALYEESQSDRDTYSSILKATGIREQSRAPFTPIIKLVFGKEFDKTRITEYASALSFAKRNGQTSETISGFLANQPGGIKGCVQAERISKREDKGIAGDVVLEKAKEKLRAEPTIGEVHIKTTGDDEFVLLLGKRGSTEGIVEIIKLLDENRSFVEPIIKRSTK